MMTQNDGYYFVIFPKYLQTKGFVIDKKLPQYSISAFLGLCKVDEISIIPVKEQKFYQTIFWITAGKLQFKQNFNQKNWQLLRIEVHYDGQLIGKVYLNIKQYIKQYEQEKDQHFFVEKVKISDAYQMQFQLFMGVSRNQIDNLILYIHGESDIRTPITKQSQDRVNNDSLLNFQLMKAAQSQLYSPLEGINEKKSMFHKLDQQSSINSSVPQIAPAEFTKNRFSFKINLNQVQKKQEKQYKKPPIYDSEIKKAYHLSVKQKMILCLFGAFSLLMIYLSMIPIKRI